MPRSRGRRSPDDRRSPGRAIGSRSMRSSRPATLVTGGVGYIGTQTVHALPAAARPVVVLDRRPAPDPAVLAGSDIQVVVGDVTDGQLVRSVLERHAIG